MFCGLDHPERDPKAEAKPGSLRGGDRLSLWSSSEQEVAGSIIDSVVNIDFEVMENNAKYGEEQKRSFRPKPGLVGLLELEGCSFIN